LFYVLEYDVRHDHLTKDEKPIGKMGYVYEYGNPTLGVDPTPPGNEWTT
jgi:hypothetical protein